MRRTLVGAGWDSHSVSTGDLGGEHPSSVDGQALPQRVEVSHVKNKGNPES